MRQWRQLGEVLVAASITNTLSHSHAATINIPRAVALGLSQSLILKILSNPSLHPFQKLRFFEWSRSHHSPSPAAYSLVLRSLSGAGFFSDIPSLLNSMTQDGVVLDPHSLNLLLHSFILSSNFSLAFQLLDYVQHLHLDPTPIYNSLIAALLTKNHLSLALSVFFKLLDAVDSKSIACNQLLVSLRKADMRVEFKQVFAKLRKKRGFSFDTWGYNVCIHAFGCWGDLATCFALFKEMKDGDGKISACELRNRIGMLGGEVLMREAEMAIEALDSDGDGFLCLEDLMKMMEGVGEEEKVKDLREAFDLYDREGCGFITPKALKRMLKKLGESKSMDECKAMIGRFDLNGDGMLSFEEFRIMMK